LQITNFDFPILVHVLNYTVTQTRAISILTKKMFVWGFFSTAATLFQKSAKS